MEELCADECERLFYGVSSPSSFSDSAHFSSLFHVSDTAHQIFHQPTMPSSLPFEEWMAEEEDEAGMTESSLSRISGDLFPDILQLQLNRTDLQVSETEAEGTNLPQNEYSFHTETDNELNDPPPPARALHLSLESATLPTINLMNILNDIDPQKVALSPSSSINGNLPDLKKIIVREIILDKAVERLGGGKRGAERLWGLIQLWLSSPGTSFNLPLLSTTAHQEAALAGASLMEEIEIQEFDASPQNAVSPLITQPSFSSSSSSPTASIIKAGQPQAAVALTLTAAACKSVELTRSPDHEMLALRARFIASAATTRAARKHAMAGRRRYMSHHLAPSLPPPNSPHLPLRPARTTCHHTCQEPHFLFNERKVLKLERNLRLFLCKELKRSDVGGLDRIVLPKKESEYYLPNLMAREGIPITMEDKTLPRMWNFIYRSVYSHFRIMYFGFEGDLEPGTEETSDAKITN